MPSPSSFPSVAVLTGDVVSSSRLPSDVRANLLELLREAGDGVRDQFGGVMPFPIDVFHGDSWQLVVVPPAKALRASLYFRAVLLSRKERLDTRIAIGVGSADFLPAGRGGDGEAFRLSGAAIERIARTRRITVALPPIKRKIAASAVVVLIKLVDELGKRWTPKQARAVCGAIRGLTQEVIGAQWTPRPISQQAVAQHLDGAGWSAIDDAVAYFEKTVKSLAFAPPAITRKNPPP